MPQDTQSVTVVGPDQRAYSFPAGTTKDAAIAYFKKKGIGGTPISDTSSISAREPSVMERIGNVFTTGVPYFQQKRGDPISQQAVTPEAAMSPVEQQQHPVLTGLGQVAGGLTSPGNALMIAGTFGAGEIPVLGRITLGKLLGAGFSAAMLKGAYDTYPEIRKAADRGDVSEVKRLLTVFGASLLMANESRRQVGKLGGKAAPVEAPEAAAPAQPAAVPARRAGEGTSAVHLLDKAPEEPGKPGGQLDSMRHEVQRLEEGLRRPGLPPAEKADAETKLATMRASIVKLERNQVHEGEFVQEPDSPQPPGGIVPPEPPGPPAENIGHQMPPEEVESFTKSMLLQRTAQGERMSAVTAEAFDAARKTFDKMPKEQQLQFMYGMDTGQFPSNLDPALLRTAQELYQANRSMANEMAKLDPSLREHFEDNYWGRMWEMPGVVRSVIDRIRGIKGAGGRSLKGPASFLKPRTLKGPTGEPATFQEAIELHGLKPVTYNPIEMFMLKASEMNRFITGQRIVDDLRSQGLKQTVHVSPRNAPPEGWAKYDPRWAGQDQWGPAEAVQTMNRFMEPGALNSSDPTVRAGIEAWRKYNAMVNQSLVSLSAFHVGLETTSAIVSDFANTLDSFVHGDIKAAGRALSSESFIGNLPHINKIMEAYKTPGAEVPGALGPQVEGLIQQGMKGGMKPLQDEFYRTNAVMLFKRSLADRSPWGVTKNSIPALLDYISGPIMRKVVPRTKLLVDLLGVKHDLERLGPNAADMQIREAMRRRVASTEDWHGQMNPDNLVINHAFWTRSLAQAASAAFKFVEFSFGTLRGMYGAAGDVRMLTKGQLTPRLAKAIAFPFVMYLMGSTAQKLWTGKAPWESGSDTPLRDGFEPRTGRLNPDGTPERMNLPTYWRTAVQWSKPTLNLAKGDLEQATTDLGHALKGRLSGGVDTVVMWATNKDFYGQEARGSHIESPRWERPFLQLADFGKAMVRDAFPISLKYAIEARKRGEGAGQIVNRIAGISPVSATESRTAAQNKISQFLAGGMGDKPLTASQYASQQVRNRVRSQVRGGDSSGVGPAMLNRDISPRAGARFIEEARKSLYDRANSLTPDEFMQVWEVADPKEKRAMKLALVKEYQKVLVSNERERARLMPLYMKAVLESRTIQ
jgi:hypothetical protein